MAILMKVRSIRWCSLGWGCGLNPSVFFTAAIEIKYEAYLLVTDVNSWRDIVGSIFLSISHFFLCFICYGPDVKSLDRIGNADNKGLKEHFTSFKCRLFNEWETLIHKYIHAYIHTYIIYIHTTGQTGRETDRQSSWYALLQYIITFGFCILVLCTLLVFLIFVYFALSLASSLSLSVSFSLVFTSLSFIRVWLCLSLSLSLYVCPSVRPSLSPCLSLTLSLSLSVCLQSSGTLPVQSSRWLGIWWCDACKWSDCHGCLF